MSKIKTKKENPEVTALRNQLARALADYDNLRKRSEEERKNTQKVVGSITIAKLLVIWDSLMELQKHLKDQGLELTLKSFKSVITDLGGQEIMTKVNADFNPAFEEAVDLVGTDKEELDNKIAEIVSTGWKLEGDDFVIRPTKVKVFKKTLDK